jgi:hypothetical protein
MASFRVFYRTGAGCLSFDHEVAQLIGVTPIGMA